MTIALVGALTADAVDDIPDDADGLRAAAGAFVRATQDVVDDATRASSAWRGLPAVLAADALTPALAPLMRPAEQHAATLHTAATEFHRVATAAADRFTTLHTAHDSLVTEIEQFRASAPGKAASHIASEVSSGNLLGALATAVTSWDQIPALVEEEASLRVKVTAHNLQVSETLSSVAGQIGAIGTSSSSSSPFAGFIGAVTGGAAHVGSWLDGAWTGVEHFGESAWTEVKNTAEDVWPYIEDAAATLGNFGASFLQAIKDHPDEFGTMLGGALLATLGGMAEGGGVVLDATGVGAIAGVPLNALGAAAMAAGGTAVAAGGGALAEHALTDDRETPYETDHAAKASREPNEKYPGRDTSGKYTSKDNDLSRTDAKAKEAQGLKQYEAETGDPVTTQQVKAHVDGSENGRFYDGLSEKPDGTYEGIEIKSGNAGYNGQQARFDAQVSPDNPATATLNGRTIKITSVRVIRVK